MSRIIVGIDEVGRGPLAGSVVAAAVVMYENQAIDGVRDSKKVSAKKRAFLCGEIESQTLGHAFGEASVDEIDSINILQASLRAMERAFMALPAELRDQVTHVYVDGRHLPELLVGAVSAVIGGDDLLQAIGAASILAKERRDGQMREAGLRYPGYGFEQHMGYPTVAHLRTLVELGVCPIHRRSFAPVKRCLINLR